MREQHYIEVEGTRFELGLWWHPVQGDSPLAVARNIQADDEELAQVLDGYAIANDLAQATEMVGLGAFRKKTYSLAAILVQESKPNTLLFASIGDNLGWIFCKQGGYLHPDHGDIVLSRGEADKLYSRLSRERQWDVFEVWDERKFNLNIQELGISKAHQVKNLRQRKEVVRRQIHLALLLVLLVLCVVFGRGLIEEYWPASTEIESGVPGETPAQRTARLTQKHFPRVWEAQPKPSVVLDDVRRYGRERTTEEKGWVLKSMIWAGGSFRETWERLPWASFADAPGPIVPQSENVVVKTVADSIADSAQRGLQEIQAVSPAVTPLLDLGKKGGISRTGLDWVPPQQKTVTDGGRQEILHAPYRLARFKLIDYPVLFEDLGGLLDAIPGLVLKELSWTENGWTISGELYAKN